MEPIDDAGVHGLDVGAVREKLAPVFETVRRVRGELPANKALIGFCGAPWTVATYMIAGRGTPDQAPSRLLAAQQPDLLDILIDKLVVASADYLVGQLEAGADAIQIFDSWASVLEPHAFRRWCIQPTAEIVRLVREKVPKARVIGFPKGAGLMTESYAAGTGINAMGIDWTVPLSFARAELQSSMTVQGNLDPMVLVAGGKALDEAIDRIMDMLAGRRFIFNLGHGIVPVTPIAHVEQLVARVRRWQGVVA